MKIYQYDKDNHLIFKSGLNRKILNKEQAIYPLNEEIFLEKHFGIEAHFSNSKPGALANTLCLNIFKNLFKTLKINLSLPPVLTIYTRNILIDRNNAPNFCIPDTREILKDDYPFPGRSIFFEKFESLQKINDITENRYNNHKVSSPHFLASFIHEWIHSFQLDNIYTKYGYGGKCEYLQKQYPKTDSHKSGYKILSELETKTLSNFENNIIYDILGEYATSSKYQYLEVFSETMTKFICESLKGTTFVKNPLELLKKTPKEFQAILKKVWLFQ